MYEFTESFTFLLEYAAERKSYKPEPVWRTHGEVYSFEQAEEWVNEDPDNRRYTQMRSVYYAPGDVRSWKE